MSASPGVFLKELEPSLNIQMLETLQLRPGKLGSME
jgi:hypothetical protein